MSMNVNFFSGDYKIFILQTLESLEILCNVYEFSFKLVHKINLNAPKSLFSMLFTCVRACVYAHCGVRVCTCVLRLY